MTMTNTELFTLLHSNNLDKLQPLLTRDNVNSCDASGQSFLHNAVANLNVDAVRLLLRLGANPNALDRHGDTPLIYAASRHRHDLAKLCDITKLLIESGVDPNLKGNEGMTAIRWAVGNPSGDFRLVRLLLQYDADPWIENDAGGDAVTVAEMLFPDLAEELKRAKPRK
jgi:ankyrin repeat protein